MCGGENVKRKLGMILLALITAIGFSGAASANEGGLVVGDGLGIGNGLGIGDGFLGDGFLGDGFGLGHRNTIIIIINKRHHRFFNNGFWGNGLWG